MRLQVIECLIRLKKFDEAETRLKEASTCWWLGDDAAGGEHRGGKGVGCGEQE